MNSPQFAPALRTSTVPLIAVYGESGTGKTYSALLLARGIAGPNGRIAVSDSEQGRASIYADIIPGGFDTVLIEPPFTPQNYIAHIDAMEKGGFAVGVIDSGSHEWEGLGGILEQAGESEAKSGRPGLHNWKKPKQDHALFIQRLLRAKIPLIVCLRAKYKSRQIKGTQEMAESGLIGRNQVGKSVILKDDHTSPLQAEDFIFEATLHLETLQDHTVKVTKGGHPDLRRCLPADFKEPIKIEHGALIAQWLKGGGPRLTGSQAAPAQTATQPEPTTPAAPAPDEAQKLRAQLWGMVKHKFADGAELQQWLWDEGVLLDTEELKTIPADRVKQLIEAAKERLS